MKTNSYLTRFATTIYFLLTIILSWGFVVILAKPINIPINPNESQDLLPILYVSMLIGPSCAGLLLIGITKGKEGFHSIFKSIAKWRLSIKWYILAIVATPISAIILLLVLAQFDIRFQTQLFSSEDMASKILMGVMAGIMVGIFEELGWTGFVIPRMLKGKSIIAVGLLVGIIWGGWHFILFWHKGSFSTGLSVLILTGQLFTWLPPFRVLMVWIFSRTESLLLVILSHFSLVFTTTVIVPSNLTGTNLLVWIIVWSIFMWGVVFVVNYTSNNKLLINPVKTYLN